MMIAEIDSAGADKDGARAPQDSFEKAELVEAQ